MLFLRKPLDPSGERVAVAYDNTLQMRSLVHLICKAEIEAAKDQAWLDSPGANVERERLIRRGFSSEIVEHLMKKMLSHGIELWMDQDGNCMEIVDGELIDMNIAGTEHPE
jgi:predicted peroxiredoxin